MEDYTFTENELEKGRLLFAAECTFMLSVVKIPDLPPFGRPEICFAGRSNVGKSSLINALTGRKGLAKTSNTPGRTQCLNFFNVDNRLNLVDMPGYGYAEAPKNLVKEWQGLIRDYLLGRPTLQRVFVLIDSRHGIKENDRAMMKMLDECAVSYQIVLTKGDKISKAAQDKLCTEVTEISKKHPAAHPFVHKTSSEKMLGFDELRAEIGKLC
ncbi:MAG: ribosome biogenesis GTP-binding protein YihA/YsxC [Alphaproteobacteria bacterium]|nr:ribosome biogenesis GTP-binding protein YihA/YsxC [Alphaproteobacteria bacterium]